MLGVSFHPDNFQMTAHLVDLISKAGGTNAVWQPRLSGIVTQVKQDGETQIVSWVATNGFAFRLIWNPEKPFRDDVDYKAFPDGFQLHDVIRVHERGAFITKVDRISFEDLITSLPASVRDNLNI